MTNIYVVEGSEDGVIDAVTSKKRALNIASEYVHGGDALNDSPAKVTKLSDFCWTIQLEIDGHRSHSATVTLFED